MVEEIGGLMQQARWPEAKAASQRFVFERPTCAEAHAYLGICFFHERNFEEARKSFDRAVTLEPRYWQAGFKLAQCLDQLLRYEDAYEVALHWQSVNPNDPHLNGFIHGLKPFVKEKVSDGWQIARDGIQHNVRFAQ